MYKDCISKDLGIFHFKHVKDKTVMDNSIPARLLEYNSQSLILNTLNPKQNGHRLQATFWNVEFYFLFHCSCSYFLVSNRQEQDASIGWDNELALNKQQSEQTSHYLKQCWHSLFMHITCVHKICIIQPQWVKWQE